MTTYIQTPKGIMYLVSRMIENGGEVVYYVCYDNQTGKTEAFTAAECKILTKK